MAVLITMVVLTTMVVTLTVVAIITIIMAMAETTEEGKDVGLVCVANGDRFRILIVQHL